MTRLVALAALLTVGEGCAPLRGGDDVRLVGEDPLPARVPSHRLGTRRELGLDPALVEAVIIYRKSRFDLGAVLSRSAVSLAQRPPETASGIAVAETREYVDDVLDDRQVYRRAYGDVLGGGESS